MATGDEQLTGGAQVTVSLWAPLCLWAGRWVYRDFTTRLLLLHSH